MSLLSHYLLVGGSFWSLGIWNTLRQPLLWQTTLAFSCPLMLAAVGGTISERSGVVNIAMEGMMLVAAFFSAYVADQAGTAWGLGPPEAALAGVAGAIITASLIAWLHAWACIRFHANQVVSGMAINLLALGLTSYLYYTLYGSNGTPSNLAGIPNVHIPALSGISFLSLGSILFQQNPIVYLAFASVVLAHFFLFHTTLGLRIRSVGEHPRAADAAGINVQRLRYLAVILSGALSGLGGAYLALNGPHGLFTDNITGGRGFIALAAMIVGKWTPFGAMGACLLFGFGQALAIQVAGTTLGNFQLSVYIVNMLPYLITIVAVGGLIGRSTPPAADGLPYDPAEAA
ncbi:MAG TPA: ABC transporter permease [Chloroflexota bacterium]|nr:ABC transporter permease [Chloroflexota bacterium]